VTVSDQIPADTEPPSIIIANPSSTGLYNYSNASNLISISGTASDNVGVDLVNWSSDKGPTGNANGTSTWEIINVPLSAGNNIISVTASDSASNSSSTQIVINYTNSSPPPSSFSGFNGGSIGSIVPLTIYEENIAETGIIQDTATINWLTNYKSTSRVIFSQANQSHTLDINDNVSILPLFGYASTTAEINSPVLPNGVFFHSVTIAGLSASTTYFYRCVSTASPPTFSQEHSFTTAAEVIPAETPAPQTIATTTPAISETAQNQIAFSQNQNAPIQNLPPPQPQNETASIQNNAGAGVTESQNNSEVTAVKNLTASVGNTAAGRWFLNKWFWIVTIAVIVILFICYIIRKKFKKNNFISPQ